MGFIKFFCHIPPPPVSHTLLFPSSLSCSLSFFWSFCWFRFLSSCVKVGCGVAPPPLGLERANSCSGTSNDTLLLTVVAYLYGFTAYFIRNAQ